MRSGDTGTVKVQNDNRTIYLLVEMGECWEDRLLRRQMLRRQIAEKTEYWQNRLLTGIWISEAEPKGRSSEYELWNSTTRKALLFTPLLCQGDALAAEEAYVLKPLVSVFFGRAGTWRPDEAIGAMRRVFAAIHRCWSWTGRLETSRSGDTLVELNDVSVAEAKRGSIVARFR